MVPIKNEKQAWIDTIHQADAPTKTYQVPIMAEGGKVQDVFELLSKKTICIDEQQVPLKDFIAFHQGLKPEEQAEITTTNPVIYTWLLAFAQMGNDRYAHSEIALKALHAIDKKDFKKNKTGG